LKKTGLILRGCFKAWLVWGHFPKASSLIANRIGAFGCSPKPKAAVPKLQFWNGLIAAVVLAVLTVGCGAIDSYYICGAKEQRNTLAILFGLLNEKIEDEEEQFAVVREIANVYAEAGEHGRLINFLNDIVQRNPQNAYNGYYRFMSAFAHTQQEAYPVAALYFDTIVKNYPDLVIKGQSLHFTCLNQLITLVKDSGQLIGYYEELISRFTEQIDLGATYFMLAQAYEQTDKWNTAIQTYTQFLTCKETKVPGFPNADIYARQMVNFNNSPKDWTFESLDSLVAAVKDALDAGSSFRLEQCRAKANFFARSWEQKDADNVRTIVFKLSDLMLDSQIRYDDNLDNGSNANEAYLRTVGWYQIPIWYLYFRKIYFPADPETHGRWEWAGVYYGERF
jgi:tetratricopeptide (TPR) repeat protein